MRSLASLTFLILLAAGRTCFAQPAHDVVASPFEVSAAVSYDFQRHGTADTPGGAGAVAAVDVNVADHVAAATELAVSPRMHAIMAGGRLATGFYRDGGSQAVGRFFADALAGRNSGGYAKAGTVLQVGFGADVLMGGRTGLHWALDYLFTPHAAHDFAGARLVVGVVFGPRLS